MTDTSDAPAKKRAKRMPARMRVKDARTRFIAVRCTDKERAAINDAARQAGLGVGGFLRTLALGTPGPRAVRRPPVEKAELARLLGWLGKLGSNVNQLAHAYHSLGKFPGFPELVAIRQEVAEMRAALMKALGRGD
jgi:mobilization protein NikA